MVSLGFSDILNTKFWARLAGLFFIFALSLSLQAQEITEKDCPSIDYSKRFGPIRDQDGHGLCWSFAGTSLIEEALCLERPSTCGKSRLSVLDASRCDWGLGTDMEGGSVHSLVQCVLDKNKGGICSESLAPFERVHGFSCTLFDIFLGSGVSCTNEKIKAAYQKWKEQSSLLCTKRSLKEELALNQLVKDIQKIIPETTRLGVNVVDAAMSARLSALSGSKQDETEFLKTLLITPACQSNRSQLKNQYKLESKSFSGFVWSNSQGERGKTEVSLNQRLEHLAGALKQGSSVSLSICASKIMRKSSKDCGSHALVATGLRWNKEKQSCEMLLRNSWGKGAPLTGWVEAQKVLIETKDIEWLRRQP